MIFLHEAVKQTVIRAYDKPGGYENQGKYIASVTVDYMLDGTVFMSNLLGAIDAPMIKNVDEYLKSKGVKTTLYVRRGKLKTREL